jgi:putative polyhydroxyalkanoate system protein
MRARHGMPTEDAQQAADELAGDLAEKFEIDYGWDGDHIHFDENEIRIKAVLGLMLIFLKPVIEDEITNYLENHFGCTFV